jgi:hypothetical protein
MLEKLFVCTYLVRTVEVRVPACLPFSEDVVRHPRWLSCNTGPDCSSSEIGAQQY